MAIYCLSCMYAYKSPPLVVDTRTLELELVPVGPTCQPTKPNPLATHFPVDDTVSLYDYEGHEQSLLVELGTLVLNTFFPACLSLSLRSFHYRLARCIGTSHTNGSGRRCRTSDPSTFPFLTDLFEVSRFSLSISVSHSPRVENCTFSSFDDVPPFRSLPASLRLSLIRPSPFSSRPFFDSDSRPLSSCIRLAQCSTNSFSLAPDIP